MDIESAVIALGRLWYSVLKLSTGCFSTARVFGDRETEVSFTRFSASHATNTTESLTDSTQHFLCTEETVSLSLSSVQCALT